MGRTSGNVRDTRDLVYLDQRGTGGSNPLHCDFNDDPKDLPAFFDELFPLDKVRACRQRLEKIANLKLYTTPIAMDDLDEVRTALGYDKIDLVAGSYGTFAAQIYMRQHAEHIRAVFLAGVAPPTRGKHGGDNKREALAGLCALVVTLLPQRKGLRELRALREYEMRSPSGYR